MVNALFSQTGSCSNRRCKGAKGGVASADFCGCEETCENVDPPIGEIGTDEELENDVPSLVS